MQTRTQAKIDQWINDGANPEQVLTVSEWADKYRVLSQKASAEPGVWRTDRVPYLREIMDSLSVTSPIQRIVFIYQTADNNIADHRVVSIEPKSEKHLCHTASYIIAKP